MPAASPTRLVLLSLAVLSAVLFALLAAVAAGLIARWDGASVPASLLRAGITFGGALTLLTALLALAVSTLA